MNLSRYYRARYPNTVFTTRPLRCKDGLSRMVLLAEWYWEKLDILLEVDTPTLDYITDICFDLAVRSVKEEGWSFDHAFHDLLMYYIYRNYTQYSNHAKGLANDDMQDCFAD